MSPIADFAAIEKIGGGLNALQNEFPFVVHLEIMKGERSYFCGGSILDTLLILTAAHCLFDKKSKAEVDPGAITVRAGAYNLDIIDASEQKRGVSNIFIHEAYDYLSTYNDIALLSLDEELDFNQFVTNIELPQRNANYSENATVIGWGDTYDRIGMFSKTLQKVDIPLIKLSECKRAYADKDVYLDGTVICAGALNKDSCKGDSGGPLFCKSAEVSSDELVVCGIVSRGVGCNEINTRYPGIYVNVIFYRDWIVRNSRQLAGTSSLHQRISEIEEKLFKITNGFNILVEYVKSGVNRTQPSAQLQIFSKKFFKGSSLFIPLTSCKNVPASFHDVIESIETHGSCVVVCPFINCSGRCKVIHPGWGNPESVSSMSITSFRPCKHDEPIMSIIQNPASSSSESGITNSLKVASQIAQIQKSEKPTIQKSEKPSNPIFDWFN